jgi:hypothetical protein
VRAIRQSSPPEPIFLDKGNIYNIFITEISITSSVTTKYPSKHIRVHTGLQQNEEEEKNKNLATVIKIAATQITAKTTPKV